MSPWKPWLTAEIWNSKVSWTPILYITMTHMQRNPLFMTTHHREIFRGQNQRLLDPFLFLLTTQIASTLGSTWQPLRCGLSHWILIPLDNILLVFICMSMDGACLLSRSCMRTTGSSFRSKAKFTSSTGFSGLWILHLDLPVWILQDNFTVYGLQSLEVTVNGKDELRPSWNSSQK